MRPPKDYINLLPFEEKRSYAIVGGKGLLLGVVFTLVWLGLFGWQVKEQRELKMILDSLQAKKQVLQQQTDAVHKERGIADRSEKVEKAALVQSLLDKRVRWSEVFRQFSRVVPQGLWFDNLEGSTDGRAEVKVRGGAFTYTAVSDFLMAMEKSGYFDAPRLSYAQQTAVRGHNIVGFEIISGITKTQGVQ